MGATQSTRKITLVNDDKAGVIKLSESLAYRLRGQIEGQQTAAAAEPPPTPPFPAPPPVAATPLVPEPPRVPHIAPEPFAPEPPVPEVSGAADSAPEKPAPVVALPVPESPGSSSVVVELPGKTTTGSEAQPDLGVAIRAGPGPSLSQPAGNIPPWSIYAEEAHLMVMRLREEKEQDLQQLNQEWKGKMDTREQEFCKMQRLSEEEVSGAIKEVEKLFVKASCTPVCQDHQEAVMTCYQDHPRQALRCAREVEQFAQCVDLSRLQSVMKERAN